MTRAHATLKMKRSHWARTRYKYLQGGGGDLPLGIRAKERGKVCRRRESKPRCLKTARCRSHHQPDHGPGARHMQGTTCIHKPVAALNVKQREGRSAHAQIPTRPHASTRAHEHTPHTSSPTHTRTDPRAQTHSHMQAHTHADTHSHSLARMRLYVHAVPGGASLAARPGHTGPQHRAGAGEHPLGGARDPDHPPSPMQCDQH
jgi:hypothetical protein